MKRFALLLAFMPFLIACEDEPETGSLKINFEMSKDGQTIDLNEQFVNEDVAAVQIEILKFYLSSIQLEGHGELASVDVIDLREGRTSVTYKDLDAKTYSGLSYYVGLNEDQNASNPVDFSTGHPLSASWGLYWTWATKYRFVIVEGRGAPDGTIDASAGDFTIALHPGMDGWQQLVDLEKAITIREGSTTNITIQIDVDDMFNGPGGNMDLNTENTSHTTPSDRHIAAMFIENFAAAMTVK